MTRAEFNELVMQQSRKLYALAWRILNHREEAEDAVQEVFIRIWKMGEKVREYDSVEALAATMLKNHCIDLLRSRKRRISGEAVLQAVPVPSDPSPSDLLRLSDARCSERLIPIVKREGVTPATLKKLELTLDASAG